MKKKMMPALKCGRGDIPLTLPENWETRILEPKHPPQQPLEKALATALSSPIGEKSLREWLPGQDILLVVPDTTRYMGAEFLLPLLCDQYLGNCNVEIIFALGNHRKQTEAEKRSIVSDQVYKKVLCLDHDCFDASGLTSLGRCAAGPGVLAGSQSRGAGGRNNLETRSREGRSRARGAW